MPIGQAPSPLRTQGVPATCPSEIMPARLRPASWINPVYSVKIRLMPGSMVAKGRKIGRCYLEVDYPGKHSLCLYIHKKSSIITIKIWL